MSETKKKLTDHLTKAWNAYSNNNYEQAKFHAKAAERLDNNLPETWFIRIQSEYSQGKVSKKLLDEAFKAAIIKFPNHPELLNLYACLEYDVKQDIKKCHELIDQSIKLKPKYGPNWVQKTLLYYVEGKYLDVERAAIEARSCPFHNDVVVDINLSAAYKEMGRVDEASILIKNVIKRVPNHHLAWTTYLFTLLFSVTTTPQILQKEAKRYWTTVKKELEVEGFTYKPTRGRIKLAIMSNDLWHHACSYYLMPFIANLDRARIEVDLLSINSARDSVTEKLKLYSNNLYYIDDKSHKEVIEFVREKNYDVLIDLGGYTGKSPLTYMGSRLAPIQVTWLGYPSTTGIPAIDYRVTDNYADPLGDDNLYTEKLLRSPTCFAVYYPCVVNPLNVYSPKYRVNKTPALENGYITFGSCNNIAKLTDKTLKLWSQVLNVVPNSKLLIEAANLDKEPVRNNLQKRLAKFNLNPDNLILVPRIGANQYLTYNNIDIVLDTSPLTGGTTTCDALWMGVPVITLAGDAFYTKISIPYIHMAGQKDLVCFSEEQYVNKAKEISLDFMALNKRRLGIRGTFEKSPAMNATLFSEWFLSEITAKLPIEKVIENQTVEPGSVFFDGTNHSVREIAILVLDLFLNRKFKSIQNVLINLSSKYYKHWFIALCLSEIEAQVGSKEFSFYLLEQAANLSENPLPIYRLLLERMRLHNLGTDRLINYVSEIYNIRESDFKNLPVQNIGQIISRELIN